MHNWKCCGRMCSFFSVVNRKSYLTSINLIIYIQQIQFRMNWFDILKTKLNTYVNQSRNESGKHVSRTAPQSKALVWTVNRITEHGFGLAAKIDHEHCTFYIFILYSGRFINNDLSFSWGKVLIIIQINRKRMKPIKITSYIYIYISKNTRDRYC